MTYEEKTRGIPKPNNITIENRRKLAISGIEDVESCDENEVVMKTGEGSIVIRGSELNIKSLSAETGDAVIIGIVSEVCFEENAASGGIWGRLFR